MTDNLTRNQRSFCMSRVKGKDTGIERRVRSALHRQGLRFRKHVTTLPGKPDLVFPGRRIVVFIDGDFWHGYRFPAWEHTLAPFWRKKIAETRLRDLRNFRRLRRDGWRVIRIWQHQIEQDFDACLARIHAALVE